jgi:FixJ family two-component response regulator
MASPQPDVVVVEDDAGMRRALERLLRTAGFRPLSFDSAEALLGAAGASAPVCLVLDVHLPGLSGFELCRRLPHGKQDPPVVFITAHDDAQTREQARNAGALAYLTKPFSGGSLLDAIARAMQKVPP